MARRKNALPQIEVRVERLAAEGKSLAHLGERVLFVEGALPQDYLKVQITKKKANYLEGTIAEIISPSPLRLQAPCRHFEHCGGCQWQILPYSLQLQAKEQQVYEQLEHIGGITTGERHPILGASPTFAYRNKLEFTFSPRAWLLNTTEEQSPTDHLALGFHIPKRFDRILNIEECLLQPSISNRIRNTIREYAIAHNLSFYDPKTQEGLLRSLMLRITTTGYTMLLLVVKEVQESVYALLNYIHESFPEISSLLWAVNAKGNDAIYDLDIRLHSGTPQIRENLGNLEFEIGAKSFYQTNSRQALVLYNAVRRMARLTGKEVVYDLYTGTGTIALYLANYVRRVVGIETVPEAIADAKNNAQLNRIANAEFVVGDVEDILTPEFVAQYAKPDVLITDPPRAGMHPRVVAFLLELSVPRIVYVSCNPATQARDLALLAPKYEVREIQPVDMFPHTKHVENIVALTLKV